MFITKLELTNFRNFEKLYINFNQKENVIFGNNGLGKTNILEAINLLSSTKSLKKNDDETMLKHDQIGFNIKLWYKDDGVENNIEYQYLNKTKKIYFNNDLLKRTSDLLGKLLVNIYIPSDSYLFSKSPEERRNLVNETISKINNQYLYSLLRYKTILKERNKAFLQEINDDDIIKVYAMELISNGYKIMTERRDLVININKTISKYYNLLKNNQTEGFKLKLTYQNQFKLIDNYDEYLLKLKNLFEQNKSFERIKKQTLFGPHRDDFTLTIDNTPVENIASQSETKLATLALKLSIVEYIKRKTNKIPVLLLDDALSDLDKTRINNLLNLIKNLDQVIITTSQINENIKDLNTIDIEQYLSKEEL